MKIYHNARCSKSRATLQLLKNKGKDPKVINYLETPPNEQELKGLLKKLKISAKELVRTEEQLFKDTYKGKDMSEEGWIKAMVENPVLIQRPIVVEGDDAVIGRPPENVYRLLSDNNT